MAGAVFDGRAAAESNITVTGGAFNLCLMADGRIAFSTGCLGTSTYGYRASPFCLCRSAYCRTIVACALLPILTAFVPFAFAFVPMDNAEPSVSPGAVGFPSAAAL